MVSPDANPTTSLANLAKEHRELANALADVERALKRHDRAQRLVEKQLSRLAEFVESHFAWEESGGYLIDALTRAPLLTNKADRLLAEHADLLDDAKKLHLLARSGVESQAWWRHVEQDFQRLKSMLLAHELAENKLLQQAYKGDLGSTD
jgi:hypothetical protein